MWSVLIVDVAREHVEPLVLALEEIGFTSEAILRDPDAPTLFFVHVSEPRPHHDAASFRARAADVRARAAAHHAVVADWSIRATLRA